MSCDTPEDTFAKLPGVHQTWSLCSSSFPWDQGNSSHLWRPRHVSHFYKIILPSPLHFLFSVFQLYEKAKEAGNRKVDFFPSLSPKCNGGCSLMRPTSFSLKLLSGSVGSLRSTFGTFSVLPSYRAGHQDTVQKVFGFHQSKSDEGGWHSPHVCPSSSTSP